MKFKTIVILSTWLVISILSIVAKGEQCEIRSPRSGNAYAVFSGAYVGDGIVVTAKEAIEGSPHYPTIVFNDGTQATVTNWAKAHTANIAALRIPTQANRPATKLSNLQSDGISLQAVAEVFTDNVRRDWGLPKRFRTPPPQYKPTRHVYVSVPQSPPKPSEVEKGISALESSLAVARLEIGALRGSLGGIQSVESSVLSLQGSYGGLDSRVVSVEGKLEAMEKPAELVHLQEGIDEVNKRITELETAQFRLVIVFPNGQRIEKLVTPRGGLLHLDFSTSSATTNPEED